MQYISILSKSHEKTWEDKDITETKITNVY